MSKAIPEHPLQWMPKSIWGKIKWKELHCRALAYLPMEGEPEWFKSFIASIPCPKCQEHFTLFCQDNPPDFSSRPGFFRWTVDGHNYVNRANKKKELTLMEAIIEHSDFFEK